MDILLYIQQCYHVPGNRWVEKKRLAVSSLYTQVPLRFVIYLSLRLIFSRREIFEHTRNESTRARESYRERRRGFNKGRVGPDCTKTLMGVSNHTVRADFTKHNCKIACARFELSALHIGATKRELMKNRKYTQCLVTIIRLLRDFFSWISGMNMCMLMLTPTDLFDLSSNGPYSHYCRGFCYTTIFKAPDSILLVSSLK